MLMIARLTQTFILLQMAAAAIVFFFLRTVWHVQNWWLALSLGIGVVFFFRLLITANNFFLAWLYRSETPGNYRLNAVQAMRLFLGEFNATIISSSWTMPFYSFSQRIASNPCGLPVLFIHGYGCNSGYWHSMSKLLAEAGISHSAVNLEPMFGGIDDFAPAVERARRQDHAFAVLALVAVARVVHERFVQRRLASETLIRTAVVGVILRARLLPRANGQPVVVSNAAVLVVAFLLPAGRGRFAGLRPTLPILQAHHPS